MQITLNATTAAVTAAKTQLQGGGTQQQSKVEVVQLPLDPGMTNAAQIASLIMGHSGSVLQATAMNPSLVVVVLNAASTKETTPQTMKDSAGKTVTKSITKITPFDRKAAQDYLKAYVKVVERPDPNVFAISLPPGTGKACQVAQALVNTIPGIVSISAVDETRLLVTALPDPAYPSSGLVALFGASLAKTIHDDLHAIKSNNMEEPDTSLILNHTQNWKPATTRSQAPTVKRLMDDIRSSPTLKDKRALLAILNAADESLEARVAILAGELAAPTVASAARVETVVQKLYYVHDPVSVAKLISNAFPSVQAQAMLPDTVVLSDPDDVDADLRHRALSAARRTVARLDQPHPQVGVDAWVLQLAIEHDQKNDNARSLHKVLPKLQDLASAYNHAIEKTIGKGWGYLSSVLHNVDALDPLMRQYLTGSTYIASAGAVSRQEPPSSPNQAGAVSDGYGLGFASLFYPLTPNLIDMLVSLVSVRAPTGTAAEMFDKMGTKGTLEGDNRTCRQRDEDAYDFDLASFHTAEKRYTLDRKSAKTPEDLTAKAAAQKDNLAYPRNLELYCVRDAIVGRGGLVAPLTSGEVGTSTSQLGQMRAALADFLFHYKLMVEYPDDFHAYLEPMAADTLDSTFAPIVTAFDDDLSVFQGQLQDQINHTLGGYKKTIRYGYGGLVSVKVLGNETGTVSTATQNYFDVTPPGTLSDFLTNLQTEGASVQKSPLSSLITSLAPAKAVELLTALGATLTPKPTTAELGRGLNLTVTAHPLSGAYGAELDLSVQSTENGAGVVQANTTIAKDDLNSRVSQHSVNTHVRIDSLKLFNISTLNSTLARGRAPWKPFDPLEFPLLGQIVKVPRNPQVVDSQSFVFVDAVVVPTAADLGDGVPLVEDRLQISPGSYVNPHSLSELPFQLGSRLLQYHQKIVSCLNREYIATDQRVHIWSGEQEAECGSGTLKLPGVGESAAVVSTY